MLELKRRQGESISAFLHRFSTKIKQSGILMESKKRRYKDRPVNRAKIRLSATHRAMKKKEFEAADKKRLA
jgi:ribosomal protein S21